MRTDLELEFADGKYPFKLTVQGILELQEKAKTGFGAIFARTMAGRYMDADGNPIGFPLDAMFYIGDMIQIARLGLIGGGMDPIEAKRMVERYCYPAQPLKGTWDLASAILLAAMEGYEDKEDPVKKKRTRTTRKGGSQPAASMPT